MKQLSFVFICFILITMDGVYSQSKKHYSDAIKKNQSLESKDTKYYFVNGFDAKLYLYPNKNSEILKALPYGTILVYDSISPAHHDPNWISVRTTTNLIGFILSGEVLTARQSNLFSIISRDVMNQFSLVYQKNDANAWQQITNYLFQSAENGTFTGEQYVFFRVFSGEALANAVNAIQFGFTEQLKIDGTATNTIGKQLENNDFLTTYKNYLTKDSNTNKIRLDENFFWKYASLNSNSRYAEIAGNLALKETDEKDCSGEPICFLLSLNNREFRYLRFFPNSKKKNKISASIINKLQNFTKDKELIQCYLPQKDYNYQIFEQLKFNRYYIAYDQMKNFDKYYSLIQDECFPIL